MIKKKKMSTDKELNDLVATHVMGWEIFERGWGSVDHKKYRYIDQSVDPSDPTRKKVFDPCNDLNHAFDALKTMEYKVSQRYDKDPREEMFMIQWRGRYFDVSTQHGDQNFDLFRATFDKKPGRAICLAMLFRKDIHLPEHESLLGLEEEELEDAEEDEIASTLTPVE